MGTLWDLDGFSGDISNHGGVYGDFMGIKWMVVSYSFCASSYILAFSRFYHVLSRPLARNPLLSFAWSISLFFAHLLPKIWWENIKVVA